SSAPALSKRRDSNCSMHWTRGFRFCDMISPSATGNDLPRTGGNLADSTNTRNQKLFSHFDILPRKSDKFVPHGSHQRQLPQAQSRLPVPRDRPACEGVSAAALGRENHPHG